ncbi:hypothetical protein HPP92_000683 [Vanilla planifolia]|uniref:DUF7036 domain-containing protein n=1 Tax=Vanilla planifolia TaxID=51239 RepID=A0A835S672_VANPL|nr:hypothetical protein HPP92_000683 [Vanilla planifolia]
MGKTEEEQLNDAEPASPELPLENVAGRCPPCRSVGRILSLRCIAALLIGVTVLLSAIFWLPPFFRHGSASGGADLGSQDDVDVMASFILQKPISVLDANVAKLQYDIFDEIGVPNTTVAVMYFEPLGINSTNVVFGILKFPGGITITPLQNGFLLQKEHFIFNFTLNFPIYEVQDKIEELKDQMKLGLHLNPNEILIVRLTNINGSTVNPPTVVETSIVLTVGNNQPSVPRVKQIHLSSFLQHSLSSGTGISFSPSLAPQPSSGLHHHHHSHHQHHGHHLEGSTAPAPAPKGLFTQISPSPTRCSFGFSTKPKRKPQIVPVSAPAPSHHSSSPQSKEVVPAPSPILHPKMHMPAVIFVHAKPPSEHVESIEPPDVAPSTFPLQTSCEYFIL